MPRWPNSSELSRPTGTGRTSGSCLGDRFSWEGNPYEHKMVDRNGIIVSADPYAAPVPVGFAHLKAALESDRWEDKPAGEF